MLAKKKRGKLGRKEKGNIEDEVKKEYSGSDKRAWLRGRRPHSQNGKMRRTEGPSEKRAFAHVCLVPNIFYQLLFLSLRGGLKHHFLKEDFFNLIPSPTFLSFSIGALFTFFKLTEFVIYFVVVTELIALPIIILSSLKAGFCLVFFL